MAVAHDAASESHTGTTGSASEASFSWSHLGGGSARAAIVFVFTIGATPEDTSVTYGGVAMTLVPGSEANDTGGEPGTCRAYFLDGVLTGTRTIQVNRNNNAVVMWAAAATVTALGACEPFGVVLSEENGAYAQVNVDDGSPGTNSLRYAGGYYGGATPTPQGANSTQLHTIDFTAFGCSFCRETTAGQGSRLVGFTQATSDDRAGTHLAIREVPPFAGDEAPPEQIAASVARRTASATALRVALVAPMVGGWLGDEPVLPFGLAEDEGPSIAIVVEPPEVSYRYQGDEIAYLGLDEDLAPTFVVVPTRVVLPTFVDDEIIEVAPTLGVEDDPPVPPLVVPTRVTLPSFVDDEVVEQAAAFGLDDFDPLPPEPARTFRLPVVPYADPSDELPMAFGLAEDEGPSIQIVVPSPEIVVVQLGDEIPTPPAAFGIDEFGEAPALVVLTSPNVVVWVGDEGFGPTPEDEAPPLPGAVARARVLAPVPVSDEVVPEAAPFDLDETPPPIPVRALPTLVRWIESPTDEVVPPAAPLGVDDDVPPIVGRAAPTKVYVPTYPTEEIGTPVSFGLDDSFVDLSVVVLRSPQVTIWIGDEGFGPTPSDDTPPPAGAARPRKVHAAVAETDEIVPPATLGITDDTPPADGATRPRTVHVGRIPDDEIIPPPAAIVSGDEVAPPLLVVPRTVSRVEFAPVELPAQPAFDDDSGVAPPRAVAPTKVHVVPFWTEVIGQEVFLGIEDDPPPVWVPPLPIRAPILPVAIAEEFPSTRVAMGGLAGPALYAPLFGAAELASPFGPAIYERLDL